VASCVAQNPLPGCSDPGVSAAAQVFMSCCAIANLNCNLDQPTPLCNDGAVLVGKQLAAGCRCASKGVAV